MAAVGLAVAVALASPHRPSPLNDRPENQSPGCLPGGVCLNSLVRRAVNCLELAPFEMTYWLIVLPCAAQFPAPPVDVKCAIEAVSDGAGDTAAVKWHPGPDYELIGGVDGYEVQISRHPQLPPDLVYHVEGGASTTASIGGLMTAPGNRFYAAVRAHGAGYAGILRMGVDTWGLASLAVECRVEARQKESRSPPVTPQQQERKQAAITLSVARLSEHTPEVDYLADHDAGDLGGVSLFFIFFPNKGSASALPVVCWLSSAQADAGMLCVRDWSV